LLPAYGASSVVRSEKGLIGTRPTGAAGRAVVLLAMVVIARTYAAGALSGSVRSAGRGP